VRRQAVLTPLGFGVRLKSGMYRVTMEGCMKRVGWLVGLSVVFLTQPAWAARMKVHEAAESSQYGRKAGGMIGRGLLNVSTCFVDIIVDTANETKAGPPLVGTLTGLAKGVGCGVLRLGSGVVDVGTFWVPGFNGVPVSDSYENCLAPASAASSIESAPQSSSAPASMMETPSTPSPMAEPGMAPAVPTTKPAAPHHHKRWTK